MRYEEQNHFKYDCVIRCRFDYGLITPLDFASYDIQNHIYVRAADQPLNEQISDMFAFGSSERMDIWCDLFNHMTEMAEVVISEDARLAEFYKRTRNGPDNHNLYAAWNRKTNLNVVGIQYDMVNWRVGGDITFA